MLQSERWPGFARLGLVGLAADRAQERRDVVAERAPALRERARRERAGIARVECGETPLELDRCGDVAHGRAGIGVVVQVQRVLEIADVTLERADRPRAGEACARPPEPF